MNGRIFCYPLNSGDAFGSERRGIPARGSIEGQIEIYLQELFTGPVALAFAPTVPRGTRLRHVAVIDQVAYLDLNIRALDEDIELPISFDEALDNTQDNLLLNFPRLDGVVFTIEGQQVGTRSIFRENDEKTGKTP